MGSVGWKGSTEGTGSEVLTAGLGFFPGSLRGEVVVPKV